MSDIYVIGVGMTRFGKYLEKSVKQLTREAIERALDDAGMSQSDIEVAFFGNTTQGPIEGQHMVAGQIALREMGFERVPIVNVENACATGGTAFHLAYAGLLAGEFDVALAVGVDKMQHPDKARGFAVFSGALDISAAQETIELLQGLSAGLTPPPGRESALEQRSLFMDIYASLARFHMKTYGTTERQIAAIAAKNHRHSSKNPLAQYQNSMPIEEVLSSPVVSWPLTLPMCAPISDGAAAALLCTSDALKRLGCDRARAIKIRASVMMGGSTHDPGDLQQQICRLASLRAYERAGFGPKDMSLAEVHDACAFAELLQSENLGFCEHGEGGLIAERGETTIGGRIPINPSGGLESRGHPIGATGLAQVHELVTQLRHEAGARQVENAQLGIAENGGGFYRYEEAVAVVTILGR